VPHRQGNNRQAKADEIFRRNVARQLADNRHHQQHRQSGRIRCVSFGSILCDWIVLEIIGYRNRVAIREEAYVSQSGVARPSSWCFDEGALTSVIFGRSVCTKHPS
jgi:hypothetical protein